MNSEASAVNLTMKLVNLFSNGGIFQKKYLHKGGGPQFYLFLLIYCEITSLGLSEIWLNIFLFEVGCMFLLLK